MRRLLALGILVLAVAGFAMLVASRPAPPVVEVRERTWRIAVESVEPQTLRPSLTLYGRVEAPNRVRASAPVAGRLVDVLVRDGDRVAAGAVLARLDPRDLQPRLEQARAEVERERLRLRHDREALEQERTLLALAQTRLGRVEKLQTARLGAESTVDQAREELARVRLAVSLREQAIAEHPARMMQARSRLEEAERDVERGEIVAPFAARIAAVEVAPGDQVASGQTLFTLYASDDVYLRAKVPATYAAELSMALAAGEVLEATGRFGSRAVTAQLERIAGEADARGVDLLLRLAEDADVPVGAFMPIDLHRPSVEGVLSLPFSALHGGDRIYRVADGRLVGLRVERVGEHRVGNEPRILVRLPGAESIGVVMITHLPNAIDGLAVEVIAE